MTELLTTRDLLSPTFGHEKYPSFFFNKEGGVKSVSPTPLMKCSYEYGTSHNAIPPIAVRTAVPVSPAINSTNDPIQPKYYGIETPPTDNVWVWMVGGFVGVALLLYLLGRK